MLLSNYNGRGEIHMNFKESYLAGEIEFEEIHRYISQWNRSDDIQTLAKFLGLTEEEEATWIDVSDEALEELLETEKARLEEASATEEN